MTKISSKLGTVDQKKLSNQKCILQHCSIHTEVAFAASIELYAFVIRYNIINPGAEEVKIHSVATNGPKTSKGPGRRYGPQGLSQDVLLLGEELAPGTSPDDVSSVSQSCGPVEA